MGDSTIHDLVISDHASVSVTLSDTHPCGSDFIWRFPSHLTKSDHFTKLIRGWRLEFASANAAHLEDPSLYWLTAKAVLRGHLLAYASSYKKKARISLDEAGVRLRADPHPRIQRSG